jgi:hypothetical protein
LAIPRIRLVAKSGRTGWFLACRNRETVNIGIGIALLWAAFYAV